MAKRCTNAWCHAEAEPDQDLCAWCWEHRGSYVDGSPRDVRHPWYSGPPHPPAPDPLALWWPHLVRELGHG